MHRQWPVTTLVITVAMLLAVLLVRVPMDAGQEGFSIASAEADNSGGATTSADRTLFLLRQGAALFGIPTTFLLGSFHEQSLAIGDFNHDGIADLVVVEAGSDNVWLLPGDGRGGFGPPTRLAVDSKQSIVALGDVDGDGIDDQAVADQFATGVTILFGKKAGDFSPSTDFSGGARVTAVLVGDFDQDGAADLAVVDGVAHQVTILLGDGQGAVRSTTHMAVGLAPTAIVVGDFNGDGWADLAVANSLSDDVSILLGNGQGGFGAATHFAAGAGPTAMAVGDLNGDGWADLAVANSLSGDVSILLGNGQGGFAAPIHIALPTSHSLASRVTTRASASSAGYVGPTVTALTLSPTTIASGSGGSATGTVTLSGPPPAGGTLITLASSNTDLAASVPSVTVQPPATSATFTVGTNALYRRYSGLGFTATISATNPGNSSTASATLTVTAQPRPPDFQSDSSQRSGLMCGGAFPASAGERGILFNCSLAPNFGTTGTCTFRQECTLGCQTRPATSFTGFRDVCATTPPFPITLSPKYLVGGNSSAGTVLLSAPAQPAPLDAEALVSNNNVFATVSPAGFFPIPPGATSAGFTVSTTSVAVPNFAAIGVNAVTREQQQDGSIFESNRTALTWLAFVPPPGEPPSAIASLTLNPTSVIGGNPSQGTVTLTKAAPPGGAEVRLGTDRADATSVPFSVTVPAGATSTTFTITTFAVSTSASATIAAAYGGVILRAVLTVSGSPPPTTLSSLFLTPASVVGGSSSQGRVTLTSAVSSNAVVPLASSNPTVASVPASVTVPAGNFAANFTVTTQPVSATTTVIISGSFGGVTKTATLTVTPVGGGSGALPPPTLLSPATDTRFAPGQAITFDWTDVPGAASYTMQIDDSNTFTTPLIVNQMVTVSQYTNSTLPIMQLWWRVRANDSAGNPGAWSEVRRFEVKN